MSSVDVTFDASVPNQQRQWVTEAIAACRFPINTGALQITVQTVDEPPCPGHNDYMCTQSVGTAATLSIRRGVEDPKHPANAGLPSPANDTATFFKESVIHELGHAFCFAHMSNTEARLATICGWFLSDKTGEKATPGTSDHWNPLDKEWADRIQEALAEFFKDVYMPVRVYDNRTNWNFQHDDFDAFLTMIEETTCTDGGGDGTG